MNKFSNKCFTEK